MYIPIWLLIVLAILLYEAGTVDCPHNRNEDDDAQPDYTTD